MRYNGAAAVIDYIVRHRDNGGSLILAATDCITNLGWGEYYIAGKAHLGKSSIQFITSYSPRDVYWTRSNIETYKFTDNFIENREEGTPTRYITHPATPQVKYNWSNADYGEIYHDIGVNYNTEHWSCGLMIVNPFSVKGYTRDTENLSDIAPNICHTEMKEFHQVLMLIIRVNLDFGTKRGDAGKRIDNEDNDTGILKGWVAGRISLITA